MKVKELTPEKIQKKELKKQKEIAKWEREKAREYVSSKFLAHGAGREDIKKIYLDS